MHPLLKIPSWLTGLGLAALLGTGSPAALAEPAISLTQPGQVFESAPYTLGFAFSVSAPLDLLSLGVYDHLGDGLEAAAEVALWTGVDTTPVRDALVAGGTAAMLDGGFRYAPVVAYRLLPGQTYVVAAYLDGGWATSWGMGEGSLATAAPQLTVLADRFGDGFFGLSYPGQSDGAGERAFLGANFQLAAVPEPAAALLITLGLLALAASRSLSSRGPARLPAHARDRR